MWWHVAFLVLLSAGFESLYLSHGFNPMDEGWPLYAAMQLRDGGVLYRDVFFVFPPGHLLCAWLGYVLDPPGVVLTRGFYAGFNVALCVALYLLGRRLMPPLAALLGAAVLAVGAPHSHAAHYLFGYRYLVFGVLALWCFSWRLRSGDRRWMIAAGALAGVALLFRLTPAVAVVAGIGAGILVADRRWNAIVGDGLRFGAGFIVVVAPVLSWFSIGAGTDVLWNIFVRPIAITDVQTLPVPGLELPARLDRQAFRSVFVNLQFRIYPLLYGSYAVFLALRLARDLRAGRPFDSPLLLAVVVWGGVYLSRAFGRSDEAHIDSILPVACLLMAHAWSVLMRKHFATEESSRAELRVAFALAFSLWVFLTNADLFARYPAMRGSEPIAALDGRTAATTESRYRALDPIVDQIRRRTREGDVILDLSATPLVHVLTGRRGPGGPDLVMPGTFATPHDERVFIERVEAAAPKLVLMPRWDFDEMPSRSVAATAPELLAWVEERYEPIRQFGDFTLLRPR